MILYTVPVMAYDGYDGIFKILNENYSNNSLTLHESKELKPDVNWQGSGNIRAWIDIVGFKNTVMIDNVSYMKGNPVDNAIIQYGVSVTELKSRIVTDYRVRCYWCVVDGVSKRLDVTQEGNMTVARLHVTLNWHEDVESSGSVDAFYYTESAVFEDKKISPEAYHLPEEPEVIITQYNNSMYENIGVAIYPKKGHAYTLITFRYGNLVAVHKLGMLYNEYTSKGVIYGNFTRLDEWELSGGEGRSNDRISRVNNEILLNGNITRMDINKIDIREYDSFGTIRVNPSNFTVRRSEFEPVKAFSVLFLAVIGIVGVCFIGMIYLTNRMWYR